MWTISVLSPWHSEDTILPLIVAVVSFDFIVLLYSLPFLPYCKFSFVFHILKLH